MNPNKEFRMRKAAERKKCKLCGRVINIKVRVCRCGNRSRWMSVARKPLAKARSSRFHIWECMECGYKINLHGSISDGQRYLHSEANCTNCGNKNPEEWSLVS